MGPNAAGLIDRRADFKLALRAGALVVCLECYRFSRGGSKESEGQCTLHGDTWALTPFPCPDYRRLQDRARSWQQGAHD
jgi:hypothetical protein